MNFHDDHRFANLSRPTWLYRQYDASGALLYVGISKNHKRRGYQHACTAKWSGDIARTSWEEYPDREAAVDAEGRAIAFERPYHNIKRPFRPLGLDPSGVHCPLLLDLFFQKGETGGATAKRRAPRADWQRDIPPIDWEDMARCWRIPDETLTRNAAKGLALAVQLKTGER